MSRNQKYLALLSSIAGAASLHPNKRIGTALSNLAHRRAVETKAQDKAHKLAA